MRTPLLVVVALAVAAGSAVANPCDPNWVRSRGPVVMVAPNGVDDTVNLQCAIDAASIRGPGAVVQLSAGTYKTAQLLVTTMRGTIRGAGRARTVLQNVERLVPIDNLEPWKAGPPSPTNRYPVLFSAAGGDTLLADLSIRIVGTHVTEPWLWFGGTYDFYVPAVLLFGSHTRLQLERVEIAGAHGCFPEPDSNMLVAIEFWNYMVSAEPSGWPTHSELRATDSVFTGGCGGILADALTHSKVIVRTSTFNTPAYSMAIGDLVDVYVEATKNAFTVNVDPTVTWGGFDVYSGNFGTGLLDSSFFVVGNRFSGAMGIDLEANPLTGVPYFSNVRCATAGNDLSAVTGPHYFLGAGTSGCTIVAHTTDTIVDQTEGAHRVILLPSPHGSQTQR